MEDDNDFDMMADINMAPLVDVVFVLLIIFMTTAPLMQRGIDIDLPNSETNNLEVEERVTISINKDGGIFVNEENVADTQLTAVLETLKLANPLVSVYLKSDTNIPYGRVIFVMDSVKQVGINKLGMVTDNLVSENKS